MHGIFAAVYTTTGAVSGKGIWQVTAPVRDTHGLDHLPGIGPSWLRTTLTDLQIMTAADWNHCKWILARALPSTSFKPVVGDPSQPLDLRHALTCGLCNHNTSYNVYWTMKPVFKLLR